MAQRFSNKVAVVTGASNGIGEAYARALAREGAAVVLADIDVPNGERVASEIDPSGKKSLFVETDIAFAESAGAMVARTLAKFGGIDYLVNNAAIYNGMKIEPLLTMDWAYYERFMDVNMNGALIVTRAAYSAMLGRGGAIVNQSSSAAWMSMNMYSLPKLALHSITQILARELGPRGIRVNGIAPGPVDTEATRTSIPKGYDLDAELKAAPIGRIGRVEEIAALCLFLLSDEASYLTGQIYSADGGSLMRV
jgi:3-oxoacyl-[acyl-carrier protein] reductase